MISYRLLKIIFIILLLVILVEASYYIYYHADIFNRALISKQSQKQESAVLPSIVQSIDALPTIIRNRVVNPEQMISKSPGNNALDSGILDSLLSSSRFIKEDILKSYIISATIEGEIIEITRNDETALKKYPNIPKLFMVLKGYNGGLHQLGIPQDTEKTVTKFNILANSGDMVEDVQNLKVGDKVRIKIDMDITNSKSGKTVNTWTINKIKA